jgi:hypothetical protein
MPAGLSLTTRQFSSRLSSRIVQRKVTIPSIRPRLAAAGAASAI